MPHSLFWVFKLNRLDRLIVVLYKLGPPDKPGYFLTEYLSCYLIDIPNFQSNTHMFFCRLSETEKDSSILPGIQLQNVVHLCFLFFFFLSLLSHPNTQARYVIPILETEPEFDNFSLLLLFINSQD